MEDREILKINIMMKCDYKCEDCEKFFECKDAIKEKMFRRRRMVGAIKKMSGIKYKVAVSAGKVMMQYNEASNDPTGSCGPDC